MPLWRAGARKERGGHFLRCIERDWFAPSPPPFSLLFTRTATLSVSVPCWRAPAHLHPIACKRGVEGERRGNQSTSTRFAVTLPFEYESWEGKTRLIGDQLLGKKEQHVLNKWLPRVYGTNFVHEFLGLLFFLSFLSRWLSSAPLPALPPLLEDPCSIISPLKYPARHTS